MIRNYRAIIEKCADTGLFVRFVPGFPGAHSQGETHEELNQNLKEVIIMLLELEKDIGLTVEEFIRNR